MQIQSLLYCILPFTLLAAPAPAQSKVFDIAPGSVPSGPAHLTVAGGNLWFSANDLEFDNNRELWMIDGEGTAASIVEDVPGAANPGWLIDLNGVLYFAGKYIDDDSNFDLEPQVAPGPGMGTQVLANINPSGQSNPSSFFAFGSQFLFAANPFDDVTGKELWISGGTGPTTSLLKNINPSVNGSAFDRWFNPTIVGSEVFFWADDGTRGHELWKTDGTTLGTKPVMDISPGPSSSVFWTNSSSAHPLLAHAVLGNTMYFPADNGSDGMELWKSDGTEAGTEMVVKGGMAPGSIDGISPIGGLAVLNGKLIFSAVTPTSSGYELFETDGTTVTLLADIHPTDSSNPTEIVTVGDVCFFAADDGTHGVELWKTDGTPAGTEMVEDIHTAGDSFPANFLDVDGVAYFSAGDADTGNELWKSDGSKAGTVRVEDVNPGTPGSLPTQLTRIGSILFFVAHDPFNGREARAMGLPDPDAAANSSANFAHCGAAGDPIDTFTGELYTIVTPDIAVGGPMPLEFQRYYASHLRKNFILGDLGSNWRHNFDATLQVVGNTASYIASNGRVTKFNKPVVPGPWVQLTNLDSAYQLATGAGLDALLYDPTIGRVLTFDYTTANSIAGKLVKVEDTLGHTHTVSYDLVSAQITSIDDGLGRTLFFTYNADIIPKIQTVDDGARIVLYQYQDGVDTELLTHVTDTRGGLTDYTYADTSATADHGLLEMTRRPELNVPFTQTYFAVPSLSSGRVETQTDSDSNTTTLTYDTGLEETTITNAEGQEQVHDHNTAGQLEGMQDEQGLNVFITNNDSGQRTGLTDRLGDETTYTYHAPSGKLASKTNAEGNTTSYTYTARAFNSMTIFDLAGITHADGTTASFGRDALGRLTSYTDQEGHTATATFDANGNPLTGTNAAGGTVTNTFDGMARLSSSTDPAGNVTGFGYDGFGRVDLLTNADATTRSYTYDAQDHLLTATDEDGATLTLGYDQNGNLVSLQDPLLQTRTLAYDGNDRLVSRTDALGGSTSRTFNALGRTGSQTDANGNTTMFGHDVRGRLITVTAPGGGTTSFTYDAESILTSRTNPLGNTTSHVTDSMGRVTSTTSPLGNVRTRVYDAMGRLVSHTGPLGLTVTIERDGRGLPTSVTRSGGETTSYARNELGRITKVTDAGGNAWASAYDTSGRLTSRTDPLGNTTTYAHDNRNRMSGATLSGGLGTHTRTYDGRGNLLTSAFSDGTSASMTYDALGRITAADGISATYDAAGRLSETNGIGVGRDAGGRITTLTLAGGKTLTYTYDSDGRVTRIMDWASGVTDFTYDAGGRLTGITRPNGVDATRSWDDENRLIGLSEGALSSIALTRDAGGRITSALRNVPAPASAVALADETAAFDAAGQLAGATYDALGRLLADGADSYTWDLASRLTSFVRGGATTSATYDAAGLRLSRSEGGSLRSFVWNGALDMPSVSVEMEGDQDLYYYVHLPDGRLLYRLAAADDAREFYHFDEMGNTLFLTDDAGVVTASYAHSPFGRLLDSAGMSDNAFTWQGEHGVMDEGDGLFYIRQRYYDATAGRFVSRDPLTWLTPDEVNPYQYAKNNPLAFMDRSGLNPESPEARRYFREGWASTESLCLEVSGLLGMVLEDPLDEDEFDLDLETPPAEPLVESIMDDIVHKDFLMPPEVRIGEVRTKRNTVLTVGAKAPDVSEGDGNVTGFGGKEECAQTSQVPTFGQALGRWGDMYPCQSTLLLEQIIRDFQMYFMFRRHFIPDLERCLDQAPQQDEFESIIPDLQPVIIIA